MLSFLRAKNRVWGKIKIVITVFVLSVSFLITPNIYAWDVKAPDGVEVKQDGSNWCYSAPGQSIGLTGDLSTSAGQAISIDALRALLTSNTNAITYANGSYFCTGDLVMVNTAGFVFGSTASVQAANVMISTLNIDRDSFLNPVNGEYKFYKDGNSAYIYNAGRIAAKPGGYIILLSQAINNSGTISVSSVDARIGRIVLAVGEKMTVALDDKSLISVAVDEGLKDTLKIKGPDGEEIDSAIKNSKDILADGGRVELTAKIMNKIFDYAVNNTGVIQATSLVNHDGVLELVADGPPVVNRGILEADNFNLSGSSPVYFYGDTEFHNFNCTTPAKEIYFEAGKTFTFKGHTHIGVGHADWPVYLRSSEEGKSWYVDVDTDDYLFERIAVGDSYNIGDSRLISHPAINEGNNFNWGLNTVEWTGTAGDGNWSSFANWDPFTTSAGLVNQDIEFTSGSVNSTQDINNLTINSLKMDGYTGKLTLGNGTGSFTVLKNLLINTGKFDLNGNNLTVGGDFINRSTLMLKGNELLSKFPRNKLGSTVEYYGSGTYIGLPTGPYYYNLTFRNGKFTLPPDLCWWNLLLITDHAYVILTGFGPGFPVYFVITGPSSATAGSPSDIKVKTYDYFDQFYAYTGPDTVTFSGLNNSPSGDVPTVGGFDIGSPFDISFTNGVADLTFVPYKAESSFLHVTDGESTSDGYDLALTVDPGAKAGLNWITAPSGTQTAGSNWTIAPQAEILDAFGNRTHDTDFITMMPSLGSFASGDKISAVNGLATFDSLKYNIAKDITVHAQDGALSTTETGNITIDPAAAYKLAFATQPSDTDYNTITAPAIAVNIEDQFDNIIRSDNTTNVTIVIGTNPSGGTLSGTTNVTASSGAGAFDDLAISLPGTGYTLNISAAGLIGASSTVFNVTGTLPVPPTTIAQSEITQVLASEMPPRYTLPDVTEATVYQLNIFTPEVGPVYFYHPLTPYDMAAFDSMVLDTSAYQYVNGSINLVGHDGLRSMFEDLNKN